MCPRVRVKRRSLDEKSDSDGVWGPSRGHGLLGLLSLDLNLGRDGLL